MTFGGNMFALSQYRIAGFMLAAYTFVLSIFVGEEVRGGVRGGTAVGSEVTGPGHVTTYVRGGREIIYGAAAAKGEVLAAIAGIALVAAVVAVILEWRRGQLRDRDSSLGGEIGGALFGGGFFAFVTGMPLALLLKPAPVWVFWLVVLPLLALIFFLLCLFARWAETHDY